MTDDTPHRRAEDNQGIVRRHGGKASIIALVATALLQNAGVVPSAHRLIAGTTDAAAAAEQHQAISNQIQRQTDATDRHATDQKEALDRVNKQLQWQRETTAQGLRILCLTNAKNDMQRYECGKIQ
jgi:hypothetical protein